MDDFDALRPDGDGCRVVAELLLRALVDCEVGTLDHEHVLIITDPGAGISTYAGPYPDAVSALVALQAERCLLERTGSCPGYTYRIAPMYPSEPSASWTDGSG
jgi:hypothetical protein